MNRQRGVAVWVYLVAAGALVAALGGLYWGIERHGYQRGVADQKAEQERANSAARAKQIAREKVVSMAIAEADRRRQAAQDKASNYNAKWQEAQRELRRNESALAVYTEARAMAGMAGIVVAGGSEAPAPAGDPERAAGGGIRFTYGFVRQYDGAWTDQAGEPVFPPAAGFTEPAAAGAASPYTPGDVLDVHGENARRCSADRRELEALMDKIERAAAAWDAEHRP